MATAATIGKLLANLTDTVNHVKFVKRDGSIRRMNFTTRIPPDQFAGGKAAYDAKEAGISVVYEIDNGIRSIRWEAVIELTVEGKTYVGPAKK